MWSQACHDIDFEKEIELEERIGVGAFGSVYRGRYAYAQHRDIIIQIQTVTSNLSPPLMTE